MITWQEVTIMNFPEISKNSISLEDNLKKALTELLVLHLLSRREYYIGELTTTLKERSGGSLSIVFPYGAIYRLQQSRYIAESTKRTAPDGRRRQYYTITDTGMAYLEELCRIYTRFIRGVDQVLDSEAD
jgi:PadR family transcriptional regulator PadR